MRNNLNKIKKKLSGKWKNEVNQHKIRRSNSEENFSKKKLKVFYEKETSKVIPFKK